MGCAERLSDYQKGQNCQFVTKTQCAGTKTYEYGGFRNAGINQTTGINH